MTALDLSAAPPRSGKLAAEGIVFLPRTIDKVRALLPGGNPGSYKLAGFSQTMFEMLGIDEQKFIEVVTRATTDEHVIDFIRYTSGGEKIADWNDYVTARSIRDDAHRADLEERYPVLRTNKHVTSLLDLLDLDDQASFATPPDRAHA